MKSPPAESNRRSPARPRPANARPALNSAFAPSAGAGLHPAANGAAAGYSGALALAWLPLVVVVPSFGGLEWALGHGWVPTAGLPSWQPPGLAYLACLGLLSGNGFLLALLLTLGRWCRSHPIGGSSASRVLAGPLTTAAVTTVWLWGVAVRTGAGDVLALTIMIYAPTLLLCAWLLGLATGRLRRLRSTAWLTGAWAALNCACQMLSLRRSDDAPGMVMFSLSSIPILAAVAAWLVTHARPAPVSPVLPAS